MSPMHDTNLTIPSMLKNIAERFSNYTAVQMKDENGIYNKLTFKELYSAVCNVSSFIEDKKIQKGDKVALLSENRPEWPVTYFGITNIGAIVVPLDPKLEPLEIKNLVEDSETKMIFVSEDLMPKINEIKVHLKNVSGIIKIGKNYLAELSSGLKPKQLGLISAQENKSNIEPDDIASIIYTSGTTGSPKGVMLSHKNIVSNADECCKVFDMLGPGDNFLSVLPLYHTFETTAGMFCALMLGSTITYAESLKSYNLLKNMQETKVTVMCAVPLLYRLLLDGIFRQVEEGGVVKRILFRSLLAVSKLFKLFGINIGRKLFKMIHDKFGGHIRFFASGGAALDPEIIKTFGLMGFAILQGYGLTETSPVAAMCRVDDNVFGTVGKPVPGVEIKISNPNSEGIGEIAIKGPNVMKGYYKKPEATKEVIRDNWFYSGDLGKFDAQGNLSITGRSKDVIVLGSGVNVYPDEVEFALSKSPYISEICVFGGIVAVGARKGTEEVRAVIFPNMDKVGQNKSDKDMRLLIDDELEKLSAHLTEYKRVAKFYISKEELPKTATRKIKRFVVKERYKNG